MSTTQTTHKIPLNMLRIEWNDSRRGGGFRLSHIQDDPGDWSLQKSAGACYGAWQKLKRDDPRLEAWLWFTLCSVLSDGVDESLVWRELAKAIDCPPFAARTNCLSEDYIGFEIEDAEDE